MGPKPRNSECAGTGLETAAAHKGRPVGDKSGCGSSPARFPNSQADTPRCKFRGENWLKDVEVVLGKAAMAKNITQKGRLTWSLNAPYPGKLEWADIYEGRYPQSDF